MNNPVSSTVGSMIIIFSFATIFVLAIIDGVLPIYWKIIVCFLSGILVWGSIKTLQDESRQTKKFLNNREDLR